MNSKTNSGVFFSNSCTSPSFYIVLTWLWSVCYGFVLLSSPAKASGAAGSDVLKAGNGWVYEYQNTVLLDERTGGGKNVGFYVSGEVTVESVWGKDFERILRFQLKNPKLHIRSRKAPTPEGFSEHSSKLETYTNNAFFAHWNQGKIEKILLPKEEPISLSNLKKGIASLFQFQLLDQTTNETDASGLCETTYTSSSPYKFHKTKQSCISTDFEYLANPEEIFDSKVRSLRLVDYEMDREGRHFEKISSDERHELFLNVNEEAGSSIETQLVLTMKESKTANVVEKDGVDEALEEAMTKENFMFTQESLLIEREVIDFEEPKSFVNSVNAARDLLKPTMLGFLPSAKVFLNLVAVARKSSKEDITKALGSKKNQPILHQLYDILGYVQTTEAHEAAMKKLHFEKKNHEELSERYLWALSISSQPNPEIIQDLLKRYNKAVDFPEKVKETLVLSLASMAYRLKKLPYAFNKHKVHAAIEEAILNGLEASKDADRYTYLRAFKNLKSKTTVPMLLQIIKKGTTKEGVLAWKAIRELEPTVWDKNVIDAALRTFYQLDRRCDSTSRTLALEVILLSKPNDETLKNIIYHLVSSDSAYEIKQYLLQMLKMLGEKDSRLEQQVNSIIKNDPKLNNYHVLGQKGLSTALSRNFLKGFSCNGSLETIQEMNSGIVKSGTVNVVIEKGEITKDIFNLGIFSGGLGSFFTSDSENEGDDDPATAGMALTVLGSQIRPFVFFSGQGELMGHVWSGTASERTTAFQALAMLQDHLEYIRLGNGFVAELDVKGAASFDLAGKIEFSLWNRNAVAFVEKAAGILVNGLMRVDSAFVRSQVEFNLSVEPKLHLNTDLDFASDIKLCMRLTQPDVVFKHNVFKIERIPGSKHKLRIAKYRKYNIPGKTYSLNKKNNNMCSEIFK